MGKYMENVKYLIWDTDFLILQGYLDLIVYIDC